MLRKLFFFTLFTNHLIIDVQSAEYSAPLQFVEEPSDIQFSSQNSGYLHCVAKTTSSYASDDQVVITWRFGNGSLVKNISNIVQALPNGTLWFKPFERIVPAVHFTKYQCVANLSLHNQAIMSRQVFVHAVVVKPFKVKVEDEFVLAGETARFSCVYPQEVSSYVQIRKWFADRELLKDVEPSGNLVIRDVQVAQSDKLYYCIVENILTKEIIASNVAKIFVQRTTGPLVFSISPINKTVPNGEVVLFECLASRTRNIEYIWKHNDKDIKIDHHYSLVSGRSLRIKDITLDDEGTYSCTARDKTTKEEISSSSYLLVQVPLVFLARPTKICTRYYVNATFPCEVSGYPPPKITWYKNAVKITNNKKALRIGNSLVITSAWGKDEGIYQCMASNGIETIHQAASLIVGAQAPMIVESFKPKNLSLSDKLDISCKATGRQQATLFWYRDEIRIEESLDDRRINLKHYHDLWTLQIRNVTAADSGTYRCKAMNRAGSSFKEAKILVKGPAKVTYLLEKVDGVLGKDVTVTCKASGFPSVKITWLDKSGHPAPYNRRQSVVVKDGEAILTIKKLRASDKGRYTCKASGDLGVPDSSSINLTVFDPPKKVHTLKVLDEGNELPVVCHKCKKWTRNGDVVNSTDRITIVTIYDMCILRIKGILRSDAGNYTCHKQTKTGGIDQQITEIIVITKPRLIPSQQPNPINVLENENVRLACHGYGFPTPRITWKRKVGGAFVELPDSRRFRVSANGSLSITNAKAEDETYYSCMAENSHPSKADLTVTVNVNVPARIVNWLTSTFGDAGNITKLNCKASGDEILNFTWFKNGREITKNSNFRIQRLPKSSKSSLTIFSTTGNDGGDYMCKVFNSFGKDEKTTMLKIRDRPNPPKLNTSYEKGKKSITIFWEAPLFDGNSPILAYEIYYRPSAYPSKTWNNSKIFGQKTEYNITNLQPYRGYEIRLRAKNYLGPSDFSNVLHAETAEDVPSAAPTLTDIIPIEHSLYEQSLIVKWKWLSVEDRNGIITGYIIWFKKTSSESSFTKMTVDRGQVTQAPISALTPYTYYVIKIQAKTNAGFGPNSTSVVRRTLEGVPSEPPTEVRNNSQTSTSISLSWKTPSKSSLNGELIGYRVYYHDRTTPLGHRSIVDTTRNQTSLTLYDLDKYTNYRIKVAARTVRGPGKESSPIYVITDEDIPGPPKDLIAVTTSVRSIKLKWSKPDEPNGRITTYKIYFVQNERKDTYNTYHVPGTSHEFENLTENRTYYFWVCAKTSKGEGNCTDDVMASTSKGPPSFINSYDGDVTAKWKTSATLICRFSGFPLPTITWLDSKERPLNLGNNDKYHMTIQGHLIIRNLEREDSKRYVCKVTNKWGTIKKGITLKVQAPPDPPKSIGFIGINSSAVKMSWINGFNGNSIITKFTLKYQIQNAHEWMEKRLPGYSSEYVLAVQSGRSYSFMMRASNEIGPGNFSRTRFVRFAEGAILNPIEEEGLEDEVRTTFSHKTIFKDSAVLGTLIGVCLLIIIVILVLVLLAKFGYNPGSKIARSSVEAWRWLLAKGMSAKAHRKNINRRSGGSSTDGHLGGSSSSLSQPASNNGSTFSLPRTSSRVTESGYATSGVPPLPFSNFIPGPNGGVRVSGSSDEGIGPETRSEVHGRPETSDKEYRQPSIPPRSSNGTPAPPTLLMSSREYIDPEGIEHETNPLKRERHPLHSKQIEDKMAEMKANYSEDILPDFPGGKERIYVESLANCGEFIHVPVTMSPGRPKYEDAHYIIGPDADRILAYRPPRCYDSTSSEYSSSRDELAQAYEFGKLHHLDDFYGRPTLESASSSGETASSEKDGICHFTSELCVGRPFLIPVALLPPPPNQRLRTRDRKRNVQLPLNTYYEKDETLV